MEVRSALFKESKRRSDVLKGKLEELIRTFSSAPRKCPLPLATIADHLFRRAPLEFLEDHEPKELARSVEFVAANLEAFCVSKNQTQINAHQLEASSVVAISLHDRPFIVNTIMECCREEGIRVLTLLHPIMEIAGKQISTNYLEIEQIDQKSLDIVVTKLTEALELLIPVTEDFDSIVAAVLTIAKNIETHGGGSSESIEVSAFLKWVTGGSFNFLGLESWQLNRERNNLESSGLRLGLLRNPGSFSTTLSSEMERDGHSLLKRGSILSANSLLSSSPIHRRVKLSNITVLDPGIDGKLPTLCSFVGLFTSKALAEECSTIPLIRSKFQEIVKLDGFAIDTHDYKSVANIIDSLPKEAALGLDVESLRRIANSVLDVATSSETVTTVWPDHEDRGIYVLVVMVRSRFDGTVRESIENYLKELFDVAPVTSEHHLDITNRPVVRLYFYVPTAASKLERVSVNDMRSKIEDLARSWYEDLEVALLNFNLNGKVQHLLNKYGEAFSEEYRTSQSITDCVQDISFFERLSSQNPIQVAIANVSPSEPDHATIVVYTTTPDLTISQAVPVLENCGFIVIDERSWRVIPASGAALYSNRFRVKLRSGLPINVERFTRLVPEAMTHAFRSGKDNDILNTLILEAGLDIRAVAVLRTYCRFLWQVRRFASRFSIYRTVASNPEIASKLWSIFEVLFNPTRNESLDTRKAIAQQEVAACTEALRNVKDITSDRIIRSLLSILENTVRTNVFLGTSAIALKFRSEAIEVMPQPRPMFEIFVNSPQVEGVHLRSGMVARGGIRWSDRPDDYRSEVLGLMKTQRIKNALIVPTGAKGGFILKSPPTDPKALPAAVEAAYSEYIRALLSITDNLKDGSIARPKDVLSYEGDDPYFVVAADKGTATFSDIANRIAVEEFDFWLGDAFASGGSNGYDHKKYGITARGGWECVKRHFLDLGKDFEHAPFTAVGIGDMAGDVFGNGLILSNQFKLVAAFNHKHIFIDPDPDPAQSYTERKRLFDTRGSQWTDYAPNLISGGGGVFDRYAKDVPVSAQAKKALGLPSDFPNSTNGESLISAILKAPVDLMWNGGIGTYVKSRTQSHAEVNDGANDGVRINSDELRCKLVGEGGNLGFTQAARVEFAMRGGGINTDAIDNSGGVDLSDHEVNLKILFKQLLHRGKITFDERNEILRSMAHEVCDAVLDHNRSHALILTIASRNSVKGIQYLQALLRELVKMGYVNRTLDCLPEEDELFDRQKERLGMARPELAVCTAAVKMWVKEVLLGSDILTESLLSPLLLEYFPDAMRARWREEILSHPLAKNILASQIANILVDIMGITPVHRLSEQFAVTPARVLECALTAELLFNTRQIRSTLIALEPKIGTQTFLLLIQSITSALRDTTAWMVSRHGGSTRLPQLYEKYAKSWQEIFSHGEQYFPKAIRERFKRNLKRISDLGIERSQAEVLALFPEVGSVFDLLWCAQHGEHSLADAAGVYGEVSEQLLIDRLLSRCESVEAKDRWESELLAATEQDIRGSIAELAMQLLTEHKLGREGVISFLQQTVALDRWRQNIEEASQRSPDVASLAVFARQLRGFARA